MEILSDTLGVDFGPYIKRVHEIVQNHWNPLVPESALKPLMKKGTVVIEFAIAKDGKVSSMKLVSDSGDAALDRAAWGGIPMPLRCPNCPPSSPETLSRFAHASTITLIIAPARLHNSRAIALNYNFLMAKNFHRDHPPPCHFSIRRTQRRSAHSRLTCWA